MTNSGHWMVRVLVTVAVFACSKPASQSDTKADVAAINGVREREMALLGTGNTDSLLTVYTSEVHFMPPNEPAVLGQDALRKWGEGMFGQKTLNVRYTSSEVSVSGNWAVDRYTGVVAATPKAGGSPTEERIKGVHIMKRESDGTWRIAQDVWNSDTPATPPSPQAASLPSGADIPACVSAAETQLGSTFASFGSIAQLEIGTTITSKGGMLELAVGAPEGTKILPVRVHFEGGRYVFDFWAFTDTFGKLKCIQAP